jgi:hypothetical protein
VFPGWGLEITPSGDAFPSTGVVDVQPVPPLGSVSIPASRISAALRTAAAAQGLVCASKQWNVTEALVEEFSSNDVNVSARVATGALVLAE